MLLTLYVLFPSFGQEVEKTTFFCNKRICFALPECVQLIVTQGSLVSSPGVLNTVTLFMGNFPLGNFLLLFSQCPVLGLMRPNAERESVRSSDVIGAQN